LKNINEDEQIMNKNMVTIGCHTKYNLNFKKTGNKNDLKNKNKIQKSKLINNNNNTKCTYNIKIKNISNNKIYKNLIKCPHHNNNRSYYANKFHSKDNAILKPGKNEINNSINNNNFTRDIFIIIIIMKILLFKRKK